jgi:5'-3' exoribonuclease 1
MATDDVWKEGADVIVSGPDVPGEGEHKVMDFIRECQEKAQKGEDLESRHYQPDYTHVLYGLDADLIMLGLVTHEPNFMLLREKMSVVMAGRGRHKYRKKKDMLQYDQNDFEVLEVTSLRQMLALQFRQFADEGRLQTKFDLDRVIDDFVFMCMMVGNDFLPRLPHLEINTGAISLMMSNYIDCLTEWGGYISNKEKIHPQRFEEFVYNLAAYEEKYFERRGYEEVEPGWKLSAETEEEADDFYGTFYSGNPTPAAAQAANRKGSAEPKAEDRPMAPSGNRAFRRKHPDNLSRSYRDFYYGTKLGWKTQDRSRTLYQRRALAREYMEGLHWCLNYYHRGCPSWDWFFPFFYSPLATDLVNLEEFYGEPDEEGFCTWEFDSGAPFPSLAQLLSVLPPQSSGLLPKPFAELMLHPSSPLITYYPPDFTSDPNGKRESWEAIVEIPFIESDLMLTTVQQILDKDAGSDPALMTNGERRRNVPGRDHVFVAPGTDSKDEPVSVADVAREVAGGKPPKKEA